MAEEQLPREFGKYHLIERVATGGMAQLYRAKLYGAGGFEKDLAVKKILPHLIEDEAFVQMFMDEAMITVTLNHGNIAQVLDFGELNGEYFLVMEFIDGIDLQSLIKRSAENYDPLPPKIAAYIVQEVCRGLDYAHNKLAPDGQPLQIVHRDVSPQNVLLSFEGQVKLVDFGIARAASRITATQAGVVKGKVAYMSPEQLTGQSVDARSDVFSAGIILYETLCHQRPFDGATPHETMALITRGIYQPVQKKNRHVNRKLANVLKKALEVNPKKRFQTASKMAAGLAAYLHSTGGLPTPRELARLVHERLPEAKPRTSQPTPVRKVRADLTPSPSQPFSGSPLIAGSTPAPQTVPSKQSTPERGFVRTPENGPPSGTDAGASSKKKTTAPNFPTVPSEAEQQAGERGGKEPMMVVTDGEAISFGQLGLPGEYEPETEDKRTTEPEFPQAEPKEPKKPMPQPPAPKNAAGLDAEEPPSRREDSASADPELLVAPTRLFARDQAEEKPAEPPASGSQLAGDELLVAPTRIFSAEQAAGQTPPKSDPATAGWSQASDQYAAWLEKSEPGADVDFADERPTRPRGRRRATTLFVTIGVAVVAVGASLALVVLSPPAQDESGPIVVTGQTPIADRAAIVQPSTDRSLQPASKSAAPAGDAVAVATSPEKALAPPTPKARTTPDKPEADVPKTTGTTTATGAKAAAASDLPVDRQRPRATEKKPKRPPRKTLAKRPGKRPGKKPGKKPGGKPAEAVAALAKKSGTLRINSEPFAVVYWQKKRIGPTPQMNVKLPVGSHTLTLKNEALGIVKRVRVRIEADKVHTVFVELNQ